MLFSNNGQHHKPHFHAYYAEHEASVGIDGEIDVAPETLYERGVSTENYENPA